MDGDKKVIAKSGPSLFLFVRFSMECFKTAIMAWVKGMKSDCEGY